MVVNSISAEPELVTVHLNFDTQPNETDVRRFERIHFTVDDIVCFVNTVSFVCLSMHMT